MAVTVTIADGPGAVIAVRCPVCNLPLVAGEPAGRFRIKCGRHRCRTVVEITSAPGASLLEWPAVARRAQERWPCPP